MFNDEANELEVAMQGDKYYDILAKTRAITISGEINQKLAEKTMQQLLFLQELSNDPIKVFINSQGGHVESGDTIHDMFQFVKPRIIVIGTGWVASAAITIYLGAAKEDRYSLPNTRYLIHQPAGGVRGQAADINIEAQELIKMRQRINRLISEATGQPLEKVEHDTDRNFWMSAQEAKEYGIVTNIVSTLQEIR
ncbi:ATP-dependent Clp protease protease subunit [Hydrogenispora ethanolica]|jgi:ATP-dependent Clp protease protease subunit|uniref:ATP-dependent Clp protease proteolytic subunit n=2 Tax=Hydrogenispora ethanolica TaxID=1082276 RepID=A0A4R1QN52_HYDET|nr:ATP-dependent Clp protease protease subunit [Hydrogenispora ethanolica]